MTLLALLAVLPALPTTLLPLTAEQVLERSSVVIAATVTEASPWFDPQSHAVRTDLGLERVEVLWPAGASFAPDHLTFTGGYAGDTRTSSDLDCTDAYEGTSSDPTTDCDDHDAQRHPGAVEQAGDEVDQDCDGREVCFEDGDGDGYRTLDEITSSDTDCDDFGEAALSAPDGDCDDRAADVYPGAPEVVGDGIDEDCDGGEICFADADGDGFRTEEEVASGDAACDGAGEASVDAAAGDCDDGDAGISPVIPDLPGDGLDQDCDGADAGRLRAAGCAGCATGGSSGGSSLLGLVMGVMALGWRRRREG